ncbi:TonB-dependent receptor plug domain-containing protein [Undibacterium umbellatum]|uniref:TonB-dependent receptor n=1 Tax=Undibacterium umbellatum TaxID=2762300 RepID=A0ABR6ZHD5_9BURK|nr:TonB-dependent receptor [Undibacterium umbellatum]MBC3910637.1 TonB-dependent receptor [Undibacterium umbellatum]
MQHTTYPRKPALKPIAACLLAIFYSQTFSSNALAQTAESKAESKPDSVLITGSRIPRASLEGPAAVTIITAEEITKQGYKSVFDALNNAVQNSGFTQGEDFGNTFTPSANTISLRGLGPNHTLILLDGRRMADFPIAYTGTINFTNLANIPSNIVERIEILNGGASAIYGSDAIAGVVNIILKKQSQGYNLNVKVGDTDRGGGSNKRVQFSGTANTDQVRSLFSIEYSEREPLRSTQRDFMATRTTPSTTLSRKDVKSGRFLDLGDTCSQQSDFFEGSQINYKTSKGSYCASPRLSPMHWTVQTKNQSLNLFNSSNLDLNADTTLFADILFGKNKTENDTRSPSWVSSSTNQSYFWNRNSNAYEAWSKVFAPEEINGVNRFNRQWDDQSVGINLGVKGVIPGTQWNYEAAYSASAYHSENVAPRTLANIDQFFLGPKLGLDKAGIAIYAPDQQRLTQRLTPAEFNQITGASRSADSSRTQTLSLAVNTELWKLPAGTVKTAGIAEIGRQSFDNEVDPRVNQGYFNTVTKSDDVHGSRRRYALGAEVYVPILKEVTASLAGRYDNYHFAGRKDGKLTYNGGLEIRPLPEMLLRTSYATSFRAPDMNYIFKARGTGYYSSSTDYYRCKTEGKELKDCDYANYSPGANYVQFGSPDLKSEKGKSFGLGVVWSPNNQFDVSLDYWNIKISDMVVNLSSDQLLRDEADCRTGKLDINSSQCADTINRIKRYPKDALSRAGEIQEIWVNPINAAYEATSGIDISGKYQLKTNAYGSFIIKANYSKVLSKKSKQFDNDALYDDLADLGNSDWRDKLITSVNWNKGDWSNTLTVTRYGKIPNGSGKYYLSPTGLANWSTVYQANKNLSVSVIINNVFNKIKYDYSGGWPNYPVGSFSPTGRQGWLEVNYKFGA